ncbi:MAG TPA: hypothetical protein VIL43_08350 [Burkholderiales bacterium]
MLGREREVERRESERPDAEPLVRDVDAIEAAEERLDELEASAEERRRAHQRQRGDAGGEAQRLEREARVGRDLLHRDHEAPGGDQAYRVPRREVQCCLPPPARGVSIYRRITVSVRRRPKTAM